MPDYRIALAADSVGLAAVERLIEALRIPSSDLPDKYTVAAESLALEQHVDSGFWYDLARFALMGINDASIIESHVVALSERHVLTGPPVPDRRNAYGRVAKEIAWRDGLHRHHGYSRKEAKEISDRLTAMTVSELNLKLFNLSLGGKFVMWSTYCEVCACSEPFFPLMDAGDTVDSLGLQFIDGEKFLFFRYSLPAYAVPKLPTVADAYTREFFFPFRPTFGRTRPIRFRDRLSGRPEVVHEPIEGRHLIAPVDSQIARGKPS